MEANNYNDYIDLFDLKFRLEELLPFNIDIIYSSINEYINNGLIKEKKDLINDINIYKNLYDDQKKKILKIINRLQNNKNNFIKIYEINFQIDKLLDYSIDKIIDEINNFINNKDYDKNDFLTNINIYKNSYNERNKIIINLVEELIIN